MALFVQPRLTFLDLMKHGKGSLANLRRFVTPENHGIAIDLVHDPLSAFTDQRDGVSFTPVKDPSDIASYLRRANSSQVNVFEILLPVRGWGGMRWGVIVGIEWRAVTRLGVVHVTVGISDDASPRYQQKTKLPKIYRASSIPFLLLLSSCTLSSMA